MDDYGIPGYYNWDAIAAAYMMHPELFITEEVDFSLSVEDLKTGKLTICEEGNKKNATLKIPVIADETTFRRNVYDTWKSVDFNLKK